MSVFDARKLRNAKYLPAINAHERKHQAKHGSNIFEQDREGAGVFAGAGRFNGTHETFYCAKFIDGTSGLTFVTCCYLASAPAQETIRIPLCCIRLQSAHNRLASA